MPHQHPTKLSLYASALLCATALTPCTTWAQSTEDGSAETRSDNRSESRGMEVVVRARRDIAERFAAPSSMVTVTRQDIENIGADTAADVLRQLPGVQVNTSGNGNVDIRMRGMDRSATQILVDGQRMGAGRASAQLPFDQLPADTIERVEVLRSPTAEYAGALGGTINIVLRQATVRRETNLRLTTQTVWGQYAPQFFASRSGPLTAAATAPNQPQGLLNEIRAARGESTTARAPSATAPTASTAPVTASATASEKPAADLPNLPEAATRPWTYFLATGLSSRLVGSDTEKNTSIAGTSPNSYESHDSTRGRGREWMLIPRLTGRPSAIDTLNFRAHISAGSGEYNTQTQSTNPAFNGAQDINKGKRMWLFTQAEWQRGLEKSRLENSVSYQRGQEESHRTRYGSSTASFDDERSERTVLYKGKLTSKSDLLRMGGAELEDKSITVNSVNSNIGSTPLNLQAQLRKAVLWGQAEWVAPAKSMLNLGLRTERWFIDSDYASANGQALRYSDTFWQPSAHWRKPAGEMGQWRANWAKVNRAPALTDLVDRTVPSTGSNTATNADSAGNPALRPERSSAFDVGYERRLGKEGGSAGLNLFTRQVSDVIARRVTEVSGRWVSQPSNVGQALVWGLEGDLKTNLRWAGLTPDWSLSMNASLLQSRMQSGDLVGERVPGQARYLVNINVAKPLRRSGGWYGGGSVSLTGAADAVTTPTASGRNEAFQTVDLHVGYVYPKLGYWRLGVFNAFNAPRNSSRTYTSSSNTVTENSQLSFTPRVFFTVGTQF